MPQTASPPAPVANPTLQRLCAPPFLQDDLAVAWVGQTLAGLDLPGRLRQVFNVALHGEQAEDVPGWLAERGFELRAYDAASPPSADNCDLVLYLLAQESLLGQSNIFLDWKRLHGGELRTTMQRYWQQLPCLLVSLGQPYYLYDAPRMACVVNAYSAIAPVQRAVLACLLGDAPLPGISPVDASCGLPDAWY